MSNPRRKPTKTDDEEKQILAMLACFFGGGFLCSLVYGPFMGALLFAVVMTGLVHIPWDLL